MTQIPKAAFAFSDFRIKSFSFDEGIDPSSPLKIDIDASGIYYQSEGKYSMDLFFTGTEDIDNGKIIAKANSIANFAFASNLPHTEIPEYFYQNAIAIFFPYLRAFLSTVSLQANTSLIILGTMNLTNLAPILKEKTSYVS